MLRARFRRWCHQMWGLMRPWRWQCGGPPCRAITESRGFLVLGRFYVPVRATLVACECNWVFGKSQS